MPVSGAFGMGEYARSAAIARAVQSRWPAADLRFVLSRQAPYAATVPFRCILLDSSPTFHSGAVIDLLTSFRPDVVVFDNAGRTAQLRAAKRLGVRVVYISARRRQRGKAFRLRWMRLIDEHWIAYPRFIAGALRAGERLKLALMHRPRVRYLDVILAAPVPASRDSLLARIGWAADSFVLVVPGGGTGHPGAADAIQQFLNASQRLADWGIPTLFVGPADAQSATAAPGTSAQSAQSAKSVQSATAPSVGVVAGGGGGIPLQRSGPLPQPALAELMRNARVIVANGGSTLLQAIACGKACVAVPVAGDQPERIRRCVDSRVALAARLDAASIVRITAPLWQNGEYRDALARRAAALELADGIDVAVRALAGLI